MAFFYQIFIHLFNFFIHAASLFNKKAKLFVRGRKGFFKETERKISELRTSDSKVVWFHCSSLGEFEQARPLMERFRSKDLGFKILITFFSPSGYEIRKNYEEADFVFYLPVDIKSNAKRFLDLVNPSLVFFVKYDFWYNYLNELYKRKIQIYLVSANFRQEQFNGVYGRYLTKILRLFTHIFVQNDSSEKILIEHKINHVTISGDLRYDKVSQTVLSPKKIPIAEYFKGNYKVLIAGSTWEKDEDIVSGFKFQISGYKLIIAPHHTNEPHILKIVSMFSNSLRYSVISKEPVSAVLDKLQKAEVLIIDNIGMLSSLYQYADIAYIGGGFGSGIHNILEAVAFGVPVIFGPNYNKFPEAKEIIELGAGFSINNSNDFKKVMELFLSDQNFLQTASTTCINFVRQKKGATEKIMQELKR